MLIKLDDSLLSHMGALSLDEWSAFDLLGRCHGEGKHLLVVSRNLAKQLASCCDCLTPYSASIYRRIYQSSATCAFSIVDYPERFILVQKDENRTEKPSLGTNSIAMPLKWFGATDKIQSSYLICENLADCDVYTSLAKKYMQKISLRGINLSFRPRNGGGQTTERVFEALLKEHSLVVCIVDSDKSSHNSPLGQTARQVQKMYEKLKHDQSCLVILNARELENLLPDSVLESIWPSECSSKASIIRHLSDSDQGEARLYLDLKAKGLFLCDLLCPIEETPQDLNHIATSGYFPDVHVDCCAFKICSSEGDCECKLLAPLGASALSKSIEIIQRSAHFILFQDLCEFHMDELERVLRLVIGFGLASPRMSG